MSENLEETLSYDQWMDSMVKEYHFSQTRPKMKVNPDLLRFCWDMGHGIKQFKKMGPSEGSIYDRISKDLEKAFPSEKFFSEKNLGHMNSFYNLYSDRMYRPRFRKRQLKYPLPKEPKDVMLYIPWGHNKLIMDVCQGDKEKAIYCINKTIRHNWNQKELVDYLTKISDKPLKELDFISTGINKTDNAINIENVNNSDASYISSDDYDKFLAENLKKKLIDFLLGYGTGIAFIGENVQIKLRNKIGYIDLLFYNMRVHSYLVVQVKVGFWDEAFSRRLRGYCAMANKQIESDYDYRTYGLGITLTMGNVFAAGYVYNIGGVKNPIYLETPLGLSSNDGFPNIQELRNALI